MKSHLHDLAVSGTRSPVIAKRTRSTWQYDGRQTSVPAQEASSARVIAVRLINRAEAVEKVGVVVRGKTRLWFGPKVTVYPGSVDVTKGHPQTFLVGLKADEWPERDWIWGTLTFDTTNGDEFKLSGRLRVWKL